MTTSLRQNLVDLEQFYSDVAANQLPAVSFVKPDVLLRRASRQLNARVVRGFRPQDSKQCKGRTISCGSDTAILITFDESGGLYDSGYIQPIDFFGDGPRTVLIAVSPFAKRGHVDHTYADHASILKFIEWNWTLPSLSSRSRDNLPNPIAAPNAPYFPLNSPAIGDLRTLFNYSPISSNASTDAYASTQAYASTGRLKAGCGRLISRFVKFPSPSAGPLVYQETGSDFLLPWSCVSITLPVSS